MKKTVLPIALSTVWISLSEFFRNQFWLNSYWTDHYANMGLVFPAEPFNGAVWGIWAMIFSICLFVIAQKFSFTETAVLGWVIGFVLMWLVIGNLGVLPLGILALAIPLSLLEVWVAVWIITRFSGARYA